MCAMGYGNASSTRARRARGSIGSASLGGGVVAITGTPSRDYTGGRRDARGPAGRRYNGRQSLVPSGHREGRGGSRGRHMPTSIGREDVQRLVAEDAALVEALPKESYEKQHLPGAINLPLRAIDRSVTAALDPGRRVVVYCWDSA